MAHQVIDSHQHFWSIAYSDYGWLIPELGTLYRDFGPDDLSPHLIESSIDKTILVQAAPTVNETLRLMHIAAQEQRVAGVVGWVPLDDPSVFGVLAKLSQYPKFVGVRPMLQDINDVDWINQNRVQLALAALAKLELSLDALVRPQHLRPLLRTIDKNPDLRVVIDHGAKPDIAENQFEPWATHIEALAECDTVYCKLSGFLSEAGDNCNERAIKPFAQHLLSCFGANRLMWGSDWPMLESVSTYRTWYALSRRILDGASDEEYNQIYGETANEFYRLAS